MATAVQIEVTLDDKGVVQGVSNIAGGLQKAGQRGNVVFTQMSKQTKEAREAAMLLSNTLGVQVPAGLEKILARIPGVSGALATAFKGAVIVAFIAGLIQVVTHLDDFKRKAQEAGYAIALALDQTIGLYDGALVKGQRVMDQQKDMKPVFDALTSAQKAAATAGKEGYGALSAALQQSQQDADALGNAMRFEAQKRAVDDQDYAERVGLIEGQVKKIKIANAQAAAREIAKLARQQLDDARKAAADLTLINLEGSGKIIQQRQIEFDQIKKLEDKGKLSHAAAAQLRENAEFKAAQDIYHMYEDYARATFALQQQSALANVEGLAKIELDGAQKRINAKIEFDRQFASLEENNPIRIHAAERLQERLTAIDAEGEEQRRKLRQQNAEETAQMQERAAVAALPEWQRGTAQIANDYQDALRKIDQELRDHQITEEDANLRRQAVWQEANGKIADEHKQLVQKLADDLESWLDDITGGRFLQRLEKEFKKMVLRMVAAWVLGLGQMKASAGNSVGAAGGGGLLGALGGLLGLGGGSNPGQQSNGGTPPFLGQLLGFGGSSSGGGESVPGAGSGVNQSFIASLGLGSSAAAGGSSSRFGGALGGLNNSPLAKLLSTGKLGELFSHGKFGATGGALAAAGLTIGAISLLSAYSSGSKLTGALGGAAGGALTGFSVAGSLGAIVGGIIGAIGGFFAGLFGGNANKRKANQFVDNKLTPAIQQIEDGFKNFQIDSETAIKDLEDLKIQAWQQLHQYHSQGDSVFGKRAWGMITDAESRIKGIENERQRRSAIQFSPPQFHDGGLVDGPRILGWRLGAGEVPATLRRGEFVMNEGATRRNLPHLERMNRGGGHSGGDRHVNIYPRVVDEKWLRNGGARQIHDELNRLELEGIA